MKSRILIFTLPLFGTCNLSAAEERIPPLEEIQVAADHGDAKSLFLLARAFLRGEGVPKDVGKSFKLMKSAAEKEYPDAVGALGYYYITGSAVEKDGKKAFDFFHKGAELGSAKSRYNLGRCLLQEEKATGIPKPKDTEESEEMAREGLNWIKKAADQGLPEAAAYLGRYYYFGEHGLKEDRKAAAPWFMMAAQTGDAESQNYLGTINNLGLAGNIDKNAAEHWYKKAALQGNHKAQANLGALLTESQTNHERWIEGVAWLLVAHENGEITSTKTLEDLASLLDSAVLGEAKSVAVKLKADIGKNKFRK